MIENKAYAYAKSCIQSKETPKYVKKQCKEFIKIADGKNKKYYLNNDKVKQIENILKLLIMPKGLKAISTTVPKSFSEEHFHSCRVT